MSDNFNRDSAWELVKKYNEEPFHLHHAVTVEGVMRYYAEKHGYDPDFWGLAGLLHDVDFEKWPEEHLNCSLRSIHQRSSFMQSVATATASA